MRDLPTTRHWIDGAWIESGEPGDSIDPATGEVIGRHFVAGPEIACQAITAARRCFLEEGWREDRNLRARVLNRLADKFEAHTAELVDILGKENGKVRRHAHLEVDAVPECLRFNAGLALTEYGRAASTTPGSLSIVVRQPAGVGGIIAPWNSHVALVIRSLAPAVAAGCTAAVMLPKQTAQVNALMARLISEIGELPRGAINIFTGGHQAGDVLVRSPDVPVISFTGSTATGRTIFANAAPRLKRLGLELGGKTPMIVFNDADLSAAAPVIVDALTVFAGQFCMTGSRLLVERGVADALIQQLRDRFAAMRLGPAADPSSDMGPLIDQPNVERVDQMVERAIAAGAGVILRGGPATEPPLNKGAFYRPTLLEVDDSKLEIVQKEVFGPVLTVQRFDGESEAVRLANDSEYGLSASVWSRDADRPLRVALAIESGTVWINSWAAMADQFEEGGFKQRGQGRMRGLAVIEDFIEYKHIALRSGQAGAKRS